MNIENINNFVDKNDIYYNLDISYDEKFLAVGSMQGSLKIIKTNDFNNIEIFSLLKQNYLKNLNDAILSINYRPNIENKINNSILVSYSNKTLCTYLPVNDKLLNQIKLETNYLDIKYDLKGEYFFGAGQDGNLYYHNENKKNVINKFKPKNRKHNNRCTGIYLNENKIWSIGWDQRSVIWDIREKKSVGSFLLGIPDNKAVNFIDDNLIIFGLWENEDNIKIFDLRNYDNSLNNYTLKYNNENLGHIRSINNINDKFFSVFSNNESFITFLKINDKTEIEIISQNKLDYNITCSKYIKNNNTIVGLSENEIKFFKLKDFN